MVRMRHQIRRCTCLTPYTPINMIEPSLIVADLTPGTLGLCSFRWCSVVCLVLKRKTIYGPIHSGMGIRRGVEIESMKGGAFREQLGPGRRTAASEFLPEAVALNGLNPSYSPGCALDPSCKLLK